MYRSKPRMQSCFWRGFGWNCIASLALVLALTLPSRSALAQSGGDVAAAEAVPDDTSDQVPADEVFSADELRDLLAPFALYPDALLAQLLPACAYPIDIVQAARWLDKNEAAVKKDDFSGADKQGWDPSVKALVRFPDVIQKLNEDLDATTDLGDAFVNQPEDVANVIQALRAEAQKGGSLQSNTQQTVTVQQQNGSDYIVIQPTDPEVIYVPTYDPATVYYDGTPNWVGGAIGFGVGVAVGAAIDNSWNWGRGWVYPPRWPGYPGYRPGYPGRPPGNVNIGNDVTIGGGNRVNIGNGNIGSGNTRPWRPDQDRYRPGQGSKPALADRADRRRAGSNAVKRSASPAAQGLNSGARAPIKGAGSIERGGVANRAEGIKKPVAGNKPAGAIKKPAAGARNPGASVKKPVAQKPKQAVRANRPNKPVAARAPARKAPKPTAFSGVRNGGSSPAFSNRGAASRQNMHRAPRGGGAAHRGGGGRRR